MNRNFRKWLACAVAVTIAVYNAPYSVEALEVIKDSVQVDSAASSEVEGNKPEDDGVQSEDGTRAEEGNSENITEQNNTDGLTQAGAFWVSGANGTDWTFSDNGELTISKNAINDIRIEGDGSQTKNRVLIQAGYQGTVTIKNLNIDSEDKWTRAFEVQCLEGSTTNVELILEGKNILKSGSRNPGLKFTGEGTGSLLTISGNGELTAIGGNYGAGIGGGDQGAGSNITISGGTVTAIGGERNGAGIGGGKNGIGSNITISGGTVTARGGVNGAGIGGGYFGSGNNITISGETVTATGGEFAAGIGGGKNGIGSNITISGGTVTATGVYYGAGIGGGFAGCGSNITIAGGIVTATGGSEGSGIGGGNRGVGQIADYAGSGSNIKITGGTVTAIGAGKGAGIGGGKNGIGSNITIAGGSVNATGGSENPSSISITPKYENEDVYLVKLDNQGDFKEGDTVKVVGQTESGEQIDKNYNVASNHPNNDSFYLYMPAGTYTITTHKGIYRVNVDANGSNVYQKSPTPEPNKMVVTNTNTGIIVDVSAYLSEYGLVMCSLDGTTWVEENTVDGKRQVLLSPIKNESQTIYIKYKGNDSYLESASSNKEFKIGTITIKDSIAYTGRAITETDIVESKSGNGVVTLEYYQNGNKLNTPPTDVGSYKVKATLEATDEYTGAIVEGEFKITQATNSWKEDGKLNIEDSTYGGKFNEPTAKATFGKVKFTYSKSKNDGYTENPPTEAGIYYVKATVEGTTNYGGLVSDPVEFKIEKANSSIKFKDDTKFDKIYDEKAVVVTKENVETLGSTGEIRFTFEKKVANEWESTEAPIEAGTYRITAFLAEDTNHNSSSTNLEFTISKKDTILTFKEENIGKTYDGKAVSIPEVNKIGSSNNLTLTWYVKNGSDWSKLDNEVPTNVGNYKVVASVEEDTNYSEKSVEKEFSISIADNKFIDTLSIEGWKYGEEAKNPTATTQFGKENIVYTYSSEINGTYTTDVPVNAGTYYVKATVEGTTNYKVLVSDPVEFEITKADSSINFKEGTNFNKIYDGKAVSITDSDIEKSDSTGDVIFTFEKKENGNWVEPGVSEAPAEAGRYRVKASLAEDNNYTSAESKYLYFTIYAKAPEINEENKNENVNTSTDKIEINTEVTEGNKDVYFYCTESTKVPNPPVISSKFRKVDEWEKATGSKHEFTGLKPNTTYHVWKYDNAKPEGEKLTYEYSIKTDLPSTPSIPSKPEEKPEEKPGIGVEVEVVDKIAGENRYDTSVSISQKVFSSKSEKVYLVSGEKFPDALSSAALTGKGDGPILLINDKNIDKILSEIDRLDAKEIVFIGGNSISDANEAKIRKFAKENSSTVRSFVGEDRYETAVKVAEQTISKYGNKGKVIIADGRNYPDAVSIASYAAKEGIPVILVNGNKVPDVVKNFLNKYKISNAIIVGGDKAVGKDVEKLFKSVDRVAGADRYDTSKKIAEKFFAGSKTVFVASGESFADSLSVSYYAGAKNAPILLTKSNSLDNDTREYLEKNKNKDYIIVGGDKAINPDLFK